MLIGLDPSARRHRIVKQSHGEVTLEPKTMCETIFEGLKWFISPAGATASADKEDVKKEVRVNKRLPLPAFLPQVTPMDQTPFASFCPNRV